MVNSGGEDLLIAVFRSIPNTVVIWHARIIRILLVMLNRCNHAESLDNLELAIQQIFLCRRYKSEQASGVAAVATGGRLQFMCVCVCVCLIVRSCVFVCVPECLVVCV